MKDKKQCSIDGCNKPLFGKGLCKMHYNRVRRHGDVNYHDVKFSKFPEYSVWASMKTRCYNKNCSRYLNYGGRGIIVCDSWRNSFMTFLNDMGSRPNNKMQIDRIDNNGNYEPSNCKWATLTENARHKTNTVLSMEKAREIRNKYKQGSGVNNLAREYCTNHCTISSIVKNRNWKEEY